MKNLIRSCQALILSIIMAFGVVVGISTNTYADVPADSCGYCDRDPETGLTFCNFTHNTGECDGNDGSPCGGIAECF